MFGFIVANLDKLSDEQRLLYRGYYCGLCRSLKERHGQGCRAALTYDMTFLILLLSSIEDEAPAPETFRCAIHPLKERQSITGRHTPYGADMNVLLAHAQRMDDWRDERKLASLAQAKVLFRAAAPLKDRYPRQYAAIETALKDLSMMEKEGLSNPDLPAKAFGTLLGEIFVPDEQMSASPHLRALGYALGRFIYLMDAAIDLKDDIRHERYNPLVSVPTGEHEGILRMLMSEATACYELLSLTRNRDLLDNILYSGVWTRMSARKAKEAAKQ